jgi:glutamine synthetase
LPYQNSPKYVNLKIQSIRNLPFKDFRKDNSVEVPAKLSELFCQNVFSEETMREYLTKEAFSSIMDAIKKGTKSRDILQIR